MNSTQLYERAQRSPRFNYREQGRVSIKRGTKDMDRQICEESYRLNEGFVIPANLSPTGEVCVVVNSGHSWQLLREDFFCVHDYLYWGLPSSKYMFVEDLVKVITSQVVKMPKSFKCNVSFKAASGDVLDVTTIPEGTVFQYEDMFICKNFTTFSKFTLWDDVSVKSSKKDDKPVPAPIEKGYHLADIVKQDYGTIGKIQEEVLELKDAYDQGVKLMVLQELSDIIGAVEGYLEKDFPNITLDDLIKMNETTRRAFKSGHRK